MTKAESLERLRNLADAYRGVASATGIPFGAVADIVESQAHGLNAVRAIRAVESHVCRDVGACRRLNVSMRYPIAESSRAVRAALNAVGIKGAL